MTTETFSPWSWWIILWLTSFVTYITDIPLWLTHIIWHTTQLIHHLFSSYILTYTQWVWGPLLLSSIFTLMTPFPVLHHHFSHGCTIVLTEAACHDSFLTHFWLTLFSMLVEYSGNDIIIALSAYSLRLPCMYIRACSAHGLDNSDITGIHILWEFSYNKNLSTQLQALYSLNARPPDLESQKLSDLVSNLCHHCFQYQLPGPIDTWESPSQIWTMHTWLTPECVLGIGNQEREECFEQQSNQLYVK